MTYTKIAKPTATWVKQDQFDTDFLLTQAGDYLLLQDGGKIILRPARPAWSKTSKPSASYTKVAKPTV